MAFFGLEQDNVLEREKRRFLENGGKGEHIAEYTWGEESYDNLGDALLEGGDDLNDETFGGSGPVGKDFDFAAQALPTEGLPQRPIQHHASAHNELPNIGGLSLQPREDTYVPSPSLAANMPTARPVHSIWEDQPSHFPPGGPDSFNRLPPEPHPTRSNFSPFDAPQQNYGHSPSMNNLPRNGSYGGYRTAHDVEDELRLAAQRQREAALAEQRLLLQEQQALQYQQQQMYDPTQQLLRQHQLELQQQARTPPPRMHPHAQSPRFHQLQQQSQLDHHLRLDRQHVQEHALEITNQLRQEERARQLRHMELAAQTNGLHGSPQQQRLLLEQQLRAHELQQFRQSPAFDPIQQLPLQHNIGNLDNIQLQQLLINRQANADFAQLSLVGNEQVGRRIMEAERMEERRRRKAAKIAHMSRYNDLMTQSDKDFITRIQVSQLVTQDPYAEDFYAQIFGQIMRSRMGLQASDPRLLNFGSGGGVALGLANRPGGRRASAMQKMEAQVEKIVQAARIREKEKGSGSIHSLQGALGKTAGRSYKAAPRQLLQVDEREEGQNAAAQAAQLGHEALGGSTASTETRRDPLTRGEALAALEKLYDTVGDFEQRERQGPPSEDPEQVLTWEEEREEIIERMSQELKMSVPLVTSNPHPFVSMLMPAKGKKLLPRVARFFGEQKSLVLVTLLIATFSQQDVVVDGPKLDTLEPSETRADVQRQTDLWMSDVLGVIVNVISKSPMELLHGWLRILLSHPPTTVAIAHTEPGMTLLTAFMSRADLILQGMAAGMLKPEEIPLAEDVEQWGQECNRLLQTLASHMLYMFPTVRITGGPAYNMQLPCAMDTRTWQFFTIFAVLCGADSYPVFITSLREKIVGDARAVKDGHVVDAEESQLMIENLNMLLHVMNLDSSQIS